MNTGTIFIAEYYWPSRTAVVVRAMNGSVCVTGAASDDAWWAAWKCVCFMLERVRKC